MALGTKASYDLECVPQSMHACSIQEERATVPSSAPTKLWRQVQKIPGFETQGIDPIVPENRKDRRYINFFSLYFSMNFNLLAVSTGMSGTLSFGLSLRDTALVALFFGLLCALVPAYITTWGPKTGLRQMIQARHVYGVYGTCVPVLFNLATVTGFVTIGAIIGAQALSAVSSGAFSINAGIVVLAIINFIVTFCGNKVLHQFDRFAWIPSFVGTLVAIGCGGSHLSIQYIPPPASAGLVLSYGSLIAGYYLPWSCLASDFGTYFDPGHSRYASTHCLLLRDSSTDTCSPILASASSGIHTQVLFFQVYLSWSPAPPLEVPCLTSRLGTTDTLSTALAV